MERRLVVGPAPSLKTLVRAFERRLILAELTRHQWHQRRTAASLGIRPSTLHEKMKRLGISTKPGESTGEETAF